MLKQICEVQGPWTPAAMNIFLLDFNPARAAQAHCDTHVVKMILETAQLLYSAHWCTDPSALPAGAYRKTHVNHPCAVWTRESLSNYQWLCALGLALCAEFTFRYGGVHKTQTHLEWLAAHPPALPDPGITEIRLAMPPEYKRPNPVDAYRTYYLEAKVPRGIVRYTRRPRPAFLATDLHDRRA
jgi:hypothetical protein